ncbi:MAG: dicarboxylate/amino acid:cation symporter [Deltaproteobacteria bacterium]|nr:dicarboxylate/amino acid:cation symporter [Deltaproteobacteria bacterium]
MSVLRRAWSRWSRLELGTRIFAGLVAGIALGLALGPRAEDVRPVGMAFIRLLSMVVVPLVFFSLAGGMASLGDIRAVGRVGAKTLVYYLATTVVAVAIGLGLANVVDPGATVDAESRAKLMASTEGAVDAARVEEVREKTAPLQVLLDMIPRNVFEALARGEMLQIILFSLLFGAALAAIGREKGGRVTELLASANEAMIWMVGAVMRVAPLGVAALMASVVGPLGPSVLRSLAVYAGVVVAGLAVHMFLVYPLLLRLLARRGARWFFRAVRPAQAVAFSTSSSAATLPTSLACSRERLGVSREIGDFCLPLGATVNMDGTALFLAVATLFIAQIYGVTLGFSEQLGLVLTATLASIGTAAVPGASVPLLAMMLGTVGVPLEGVGIILGIDRVLDMCRTVVNITGDLVGVVIVGRSEGKLAEEPPPLP